MNIIVNLVFASVLIHAFEGSVKTYNGVKFNGEKDIGFGSAVAINNAYTVISSLRDSGGGNLKTGSVSLYANGSLSDMKKLEPTDGKLYQHFGSSVAINKKYIVIGSQQDRGKTFHEGSVYVYPTDGEISEYKKIVLKDAATDDHLGYSVDINEDNEIVVGAPYMGQYGNRSGAVYVFTFNGATWIQVQKLQPSNAKRYHGIGKAVSITKNFIAIGARGQDNSDPSLFRAGAVYIYKKNSNGLWEEQIEIKSPKPMNNGQFGFSVSIDDKRVVIGAPLQDSSKGNVYVYERVDNTWTLEGELKADDWQGHTNFGFSVSIHKSNAVVGTYSDLHRRSGVVHIFELSNEEWVEKGKFIAKDGENVYSVKTVRIFNKNVIVGCIRYAGSSGIFGAAYLFQV